MLPDDRWWSDVDRRHRVVASAAIIGGVIVLAVAVGVAVAVLGPRLGPAPTASRPATPGASTRTPDASVPVTGSPSPTGPVDGTSEGPARRPVSRATLVAFRRAGSIWIAGEDGEGAERVTTSIAGAFALSPDGSSLAVVEQATGRLSVVDAESGRAVDVDAALPETPSWSADSRRLAYTAQVEGGHDTVVRVLTRGGRLSTLGGGYGPRFAGDGSIVAVSALRGPAGTPLAVFESGRIRIIGGKGSTANAVAPLPGGYVFCDAGSIVLQGAQRPPSIRVIEADGSGRRTIVGRPLTSDSTFFGAVDASPDGRWIAFTESGDDGYSRLFVVSPKGGSPRRLSTRRDAYLLGWDASGRSILYIDGNALDGESTRLMSVRPDGTGRRTVVEDAGL